MSKETLRAKIAALTDEQIEEGAVALEGRTPEERFVRAWMIDEYERRHGEEAADKLMEACGL